MDKGICVGAMVRVQGLQKDTGYNGALAEVMKFILSEPENKCEVKVVQNEKDSEKHLVLKLSRLALLQEPSLQSPEPHPEPQAAESILIPYAEASTATPEVELPPVQPSPVPVPPCPVFGGTPVQLMSVPDMKPMVWR